MANEAKIIELFNGGRPIRYTCADGVTIPKGTLLEMTGDRTVEMATTGTAPFVGIAAHEKVASDGATTISAYTDGIFDMVSDSGTDVVGTVMATSAADNIIETGVAADLLSQTCVGYYLEAGTNAGTESVRINK